MASNGNRWNSGAKPYPLYEMAVSRGNRYTRSDNYAAMMVINRNVAAQSREAIIVNFSIEWYVEDQVLFVKHWGATQAEDVRTQMETMNHQLDLSTGQPTTSRLPQQKPTRQPGILYALERV